MTPDALPRRSPLLAITMTELRMALRTGFFRLSALLLFALGWSVGGGAAGRGVSASAYAAGEVACQQLAIAAVLLAALAAVRDTTQRTGMLVYTKPQPPERLALARFLGLYGQILLLLLALFVGAGFGRVLAGGILAGLPAYGLQYVRAAGVLFFAASAGYSLALLADSPIAGAIVGLYWTFALSGREFLAKFYFPWYGQNTLAYAFLGAALLGFALTFSRRRLRGERPAAAWARLSAPLALVAGGALLWTTTRNAHDPLAFQHAGMIRMGEQTFQEGALIPGLLLPDQNGRATSLSQFPGRILIVALWSPRDPDSVAMLARLHDIYGRYGARGVLPIAVCLSEDASAASTFALGERIAFPVLYDWGTYNASRAMEASPLAVAYRADILPRLIVTDRRHRVRAALDGLTATEADWIEAEVRARVESEPE